MPITTEPAPPPAVNPDLLFHVLKPRGLFAVFDPMSPEACILVHDSDGETVVRVRREIHPIDLSTLLDYGRRQFEAGCVFGEDSLAAKFRALLEPRSRVG